MKKKLASIIITNYNKEKYIKKTIASAIAQSYKNIEILVFDDKSNDGSTKIIKDFKGIKKIFNRRRKLNSAPLNQLNAIIKAFLKSKGEYIFFLDGDDEIKKNKVKEIIKIFNFNKKKDLVQDKPYLSKEKKILKLKIKKHHFSIWPSIYPTSCIAIRRRFMTEFVKFSQKKKFSNLEIDARIIIFSFLKKKMKVINNSYTFYNHDKNGITSNYLKFRKNWWKKRYEAFLYMKYLSKKIGLKFKKGPDYYLTQLINSYFN